MSPGPSPTLLSDWITIPGFLWLTLGCIAVAVLVILTCNIVRVWEENDAANEDAQDEHTQQQVDRYHCAAHGHYYGAAPEVFNDCDVWTCKNCGHEAPVMHGGRKPFDQASA